MATKFFDCENCGGHGKIVFKESDFTTEEVAFCPFCGGDIYTAEEDEEE
jgi:rRNA maturation endonuclease Nob1